MENPRFNTWIRKKGVIDFYALYELVPDFFFTRRFFIQERQFKQKKGTARGKEFEIIWFITRKIDEYKKYEGEVYIYIDNAVEVEIEKDGKKKKMFKGDAHIRLQMAIRNDWQEKWTGPFKSRLKKFYEGYIIDEELRARVAEMYNTMFELSEKIKQTLEIEGATHWLK